jgi:hypothetical protein
MAKGAEVFLWPKVQRRAQRPETMKTPILHTEFDVLVGRGGHGNNHVGIQWFREHTKTLRPSYLVASKYRKTSISKELVDWVHCSGGSVPEGICQFRSVDLTLLSADCAAKVASNYCTYCS